MAPISYFTHEHLFIINSKTIPYFTGTNKNIILFNEVESMSNVDIGLIVSLVSIVIAAITAMVAMFTKLKKKFGELAKDGNWKKLYPMILRAMADAEATGQSGAEKKEIVMAAVDSFAKEFGIQYEVDQISDAIEFIIDFSKKVNKK